LIDADEDVALSDMVILASLLALVQVLMAWHAH